MDFFKLFTILLALSKFGHCLKGGKSLSAGDIALNKYGVGLYVAENGASCICVLVLPGNACLYMGGCGEFNNAANETMVMGTVYNAYPHSKNPVASCVGYQTSYASFAVNLQGAPPKSLVAATLPQSSLSFAPPTGTKCQILGFSSKTDNIPNRLDVLVMDLDSCATKTGQSNLKAKRHFCTHIVPQPLEGPFGEGDFLTPTFCQKWSQPGTKIFWPFSKEEEDEEEPMVFVGFVVIRISLDNGENVENILIHETFQCPN